MGLRGQHRVVAVVSLCALLSCAMLVQAQRPQLTVQKGHTESVHLMAFAPDGRTLASSSLDNTVRLWDVDTGWELAALDAEGEMLETLAFSADGRVLAGAARHLMLWDATTGRRLHLFNDASVEQLLVSPDGRQLLVVRGNNAVELLDAADGRAVKTFQRGDKNTHFALNETRRARIAAAPDWQTFVSYDAAGVRVWDAARGRERFALKFAPGTLAVSHDGALLAATDSAQATVKVFDSKTGQQLWQQPTVARARLAFSADDRQLVSFAVASTVVWAARDGAELEHAPGLREDPQAANDVERDLSAAVSPDGQLYAYSPPGDRDTQIDLYACAGRRLRTLAGRAAPLNAVAFSPDGKSLALGPDDRHISNDTSPDAVDDGIVLWNYADGTQVRALRKYAGAADSFAYSPDGKYLAVAGLLKLNVWDVASGTAREFEDSVSYGAVAFSPDGQTLAAYDYKALKLWDVASGRVVRQLAENQKRANDQRSFGALAFSPDGKYLAVVDAAKQGVVLFDVATGQAARVIEAPASAITFSPDGRFIVAGDAEQRVLFIDAQTGALARAITPAVEQSARLLGYLKFAFSPDGKILAGIVVVNDPQSELTLNGASGHGFHGASFVRLWDAATGAELRTLRGHTDLVSALSFSNDGKLLLTGSFDRLAKLWDVSTGAELASLVPVNQNDWLVTTPDGLFDGSPGGWQAILWRFSDKARDVLPVEAFFNEFYYPNLLTELLDGKRPVAPHGLAERDRRAPQLDLSVVAAAPDAAAGSAASARSVNVKLNIKAAPGGARDVRLFRNGSLVKAWRGDVLNGQASVALAAAVPVVAGDNHLTAYAFNRDNVKSPDAELYLTGADTLKRKGIIYLLTVGVNEYENAAFNLKYAVADAQSFADRFVAQQARLGQYASVARLVLTDARATKANLLRAFAAFAARVQPEDAVVIYFAGHGLAHDNQFYLLPHDLGYAGGRAQITPAALQTLLAHSVSDRELETAFEGIGAGLFLFVIDACNSGQALEAAEKRRGPMNAKGLAQLAYEKGMYILTAAQSFQAAQEVAKLGHGLLTYALVEEGLQAAADSEPKDGRILLREWLDYATRRVPEMRVQELERAAAAGRGLSFADAAPDDERTLSDAPRRRSGQRPRVFYRREPEAAPLVVARP